MTRFSRIKDIITEHDLSWQGKIFLTFDLDWCSDAVLDFTIDLVEDARVPTTWFVTHDTPRLQRLRENPLFELGVHPDFNPLLNGDDRYGRTARDVIEHFTALVPDAVSVRSHSMTQSSVLLSEFADAGLRFDCNHFVPHQATTDLRPWRFWDERLVRVPYHWEDDLHCVYQWPWDVNRHLHADRLNVFDFHPIHIFLNTEHLDRYEASRCAEFDTGELAQYINHDVFGTCDFFKTLLTLGKCESQS